MEQAMKTWLGCVCVASVAVWAMGCGSSSEGPRRLIPGSTVDDSCGVDCDAQAHYGLTLSTCFEYTTQASGTSDPADLGVFVRGVGKLEGDVPVIDLEYRQSGQILRTDSIRLTDGDFLLARRSGTFGSYTYVNDAGVPEGVAWLRAGSKVGQASTTVATVDAIVDGTRAKVPVSYRVDVVTPSVSEKDLTVPQGSYDEGLKLIVTENPSHDTDPQRVFVPSVGFVRFTSKLGQSGNYQTYRLQKFRPIPEGDESCGLGSP
jgi:hypothetical protein